MEGKLNVEATFSFGDSQSNDGFVAHCFFSWSQKRRDSGTRRKRCKAFHPDKEPEFIGKRVEEHFNCTSSTLLAGS